MIEVQNSYSLTEGIHHVMIAIGIERIAAIATRDRDWYAAVAHFVDRRDAAPTWRPPIAPILKIKIDGWQRHLSRCPTRRRGRGSGVFALLAALPGCSNGRTPRPLNRLRSTAAATCASAVAALGWAVLVGIAIRVALLKWKGAEASGPMEVLAAGFIGGDALYGFFDSVIKTAVSKVK